MVDCCVNIIYFYFMSQATKIVLGAVVIALIGWGIYAASGANQGQSTAGPVKIGALFPLTGGLANYGEVIRNATQIAVDEINAAGGIDGRKLEVNYQDHQCQPATAVSAFQQLANTQDTHLFISAACSGTVSAVAPLLGDKNILLGTLITASKLSGISPSVFRNYASDTDGVNLFAKYILDKGFKSVAILYEETDYAKGIKIGLENALRDNGVTIVSEGFVTDAADLRTPVAKLKAAGTEALFLSPQTVTTGDKILQSMQQLSFKPGALLVNENVYRSTDLMSRYAGLLEGAVSVDYVIAQNEKNEKMLAAYKARFGKECPYVNICTTGYDNIYMLKAAIEKEGMDIVDIRSYLSKVSYEGISGKIQFSEKNDRKGTDYTLFMVRDGKGVKIGN